MIFPAKRKNFVLEIVEMLGRRKIKIKRIVLMSTEEESSEFPI